MSPDTLPPHAADRRPWTPDQTALWRRIEAHPFEATDQADDLTRRLARDKDWPLDFARGAVAEYRRFGFLCRIADAPMTPSEEVDEVWHLHLLYTRDYWGTWCGEALGAPLHHDPTRGGTQQAAYFLARYAATLAAYERWFGPPPETYWPGARERFRRRPRYRGLDADRAAMLPRFWSPRFWRIALSRRFER